MKVIRMRGRHLVLSLLCSRKKIKISSNNSSSSSSSSSSNVVSRSQSQASRETNPRYGPSSSAQSTDFTSAIKTSQMTIKTATTVKNITDKPNPIPLAPGSAHRISNADLEIEENIPKGRQGYLKGIIIANHILILLCNQI